MSPSSTSVTVKTGEPSADHSDWLTERVPKGDLGRLCVSR